MPPFRRQAGAGRASYPGSAFRRRWPAGFGCRRMTPAAKLGVLRGTGSAARQKSSGRPLAAEVRRVLASRLADRGFLMPGSGTPHLRQTVANPSQTGWNQLTEPLSCCFTPAPGVIVGQSGEKTAAAPVSLPQNGTKRPL